MLPSVKSRIAEQSGFIALMSAASASGSFSAISGRIFSRILTSSGVTRGSTSALMP